MGTLVLISCSKKNSCGFRDSSLAAPQTEQTALLDSLQTHNLQAVLHPSGVYYQILSQDSGDKTIVLCSNITVTYWAGFFNGSGFDSSAAPVSFALGQTIVGWQKAIPMLKGTGSINIYVPPTLGYGGKNITDASGRVIIPPNSFLVFRVKVSAID